MANNNELNKPLKKKKTHQKPKELYFKAQFENRIKEPHVP